jgi:hypothetical protein
MENKMSDELETYVKTADGVTVSISEWDDGGAWINLVHRHGSAYTGLTRDEAKQLLVGLQAIFDKGAA